MVKFLALVLAIFLIISAWAIIKRRLKLAFKVGTVLYALLFIGRLARFGVEEQRAEELALVAAVFAGVWLLVWGVVTLVSRLRKDQVATPRTITDYLIDRFKPR